MIIRYCVSHHNDGYHWSNESKNHPFVTGQPATVYRESRKDFIYIYVSIYATCTAHIHVDILFTMLLLHDSRFDFIIVWATFIVRVSDEVVVMP